MPISSLRDHMRPPDVQGHGTTPVHVPTVAHRTSASSSPRKTFMSTSPRIPSTSPALLYCQIVHSLHGAGVAASATGSRGCLSLIESFA